MVLRKKIVSYSWSSIFLLQTTIPTNTKALLAFFFLTGAEETIVRTRGLLSVISDQATILEEQRGAFGMIRVTDRARVAGAVSIPGPATDANDDGWFTWVPICQDSVQDVAGGLNGMQYVIDSKSQRIIQTGTDVAVMIENEGSVGGMKIQLVLRLLSRLRT